MSDISEIFRSMVFNDSVMKERLPKETYNALKKTIKESKALDMGLASIIANAMKDWAIEKGVTHYTHWFQPMHGVTAEKHDSFIAPSKDDNIIMTFSGKELIMGESDASSFPSGGLRAIFEARGYTAWDPTSYAFIKDGVLCIPTVFCSYAGDSLDKKTPLLRSTQLISKHAKRILKLFGHNDIRAVTPEAGAEQEYFLINKEHFESRIDLKLCGRTLFGAKPPKGQELDDHYFGAIPDRVLKFMRDLDEELWKLGIMSNTEHNEVAPCQHELAPIYTNVNTATDHNQLTMEIMKKVAPRHNMVCLLHEKPFEGINGSGKHNNWSLSYDGNNLLSSGAYPQNNTLFLLFLCAVIKAVDEYQDLLRVCVATASNDYRLGGNEAPPPILSVYLGEDLLGILESIESGEVRSNVSPRAMEAGVRVLPKFQMDTSDRNRTSPFAFTGNKFEFRMPGSSQSVADPNTIMNTIVGDVLCGFADVLESASDFEKALEELMRKTICEHKRIIYNGNNYSDEWKAEAKRRGLCVFNSTVEALPSLIAEKNIQLFTRNGILSEREILSRYEILLESYCKVINIEANTMVYMAKRQIMPAVSAYESRLASALAAKRAAAADICCETEQRLLCDLARHNDDLFRGVLKLEEEIKTASGISDTSERADYFCRTVLETMKDVRSSADALEPLTEKESWPFPTYAEIFFAE